jgi:hypothetical protein
MDNVINGNKAGVDIYNQKAQTNRNNFLYRKDYIKIFTYFKTDIFIQFNLF